MPGPTLTFYPTWACATPGHTLLPLLLHRLDPKKLQEALHQVFPEADLGGVLVVDGKHLRGSGKGKSPQVRLVEVLALHLKTTLAQARVEGKVVEKGGIPLRSEGQPGGTAGVGSGGVQGDKGEAASRGDGRGLEGGAGRGGTAHGKLRPHQPGGRGGGREAAWELLLSRWEVENRSFWVRDVLLYEEACQVRGVGAQVLAALRAFLVSLLHRRGCGRRSRASVP